MRLASLNTKIQDIRNYCDSQADACNDFVVETKLAYTNALNTLQSAVANYYSSTYAAQREQQLNELIMTLYQTKTLSYLEIAGDEGLSVIDESSAPYGYSDFTLLFDMGTFADNFLSAPLSSFWEGCPTVAITDPEAELPTIYNWIGAATNQESVDAEARAALINWAKLTNIANSYIFLFEDVTASDNRPANAKQAIGEDLFVDRKAAEVIRYFNLNIRIPSYIP